MHCWTTQWWGIVWHLLCASHTAISFNTCSAHLCVYSHSITGSIKRGIFVRTLPLYWLSVCDLELALWSLPALAGQSCLSSPVMVPLRLAVSHVPWEGWKILPRKMSTLWDEKPSRFCLGRFIRSGGISYKTSWPFWGIAFDVFRRCLLCCVCITWRVRFFSFHRSGPELMPEKTLKRDIQLRAATSAGSRIFVSHLGLDTATWFFVSLGLGTAANLSDHWVYVSQHSDQSVWSLGFRFTRTRHCHQPVWSLGFRFTRTRHCHQPIWSLGFSFHKY